MPGLHNNQLSIHTAYGEVLPAAEVDRGTSLKWIVAGGRVSSISLVRRYAGGSCRSGPFPVAPVDSVSISRMTWYRVSLAS